MADDVELSIERSGYESIPLPLRGDYPFLFQPGTAGTGAPPVVLRFAESAGEGASFQGSRTTKRPLDLEVLIQGNARKSTGELVRQLTVLVSTERNRPQPRLVARLAGGMTLELPFVYSSGLETNYGEALPVAYPAPLSLICPAPFWTARDAIPIGPIRAASIAPELLSDLAAIPLASSTAFGEVVFENPGDVETPVIWRVTGPGGPISVVIDGEGFTIDQVLEAGEVRFVDTAMKTITDAAGVDRYEDFGPVPRFPMIPRGTVTIEVSMDDATEASEVAGFIRPRYRGVF